MHGPRNKKKYWAISTELKLRRVNLTTDFHSSTIFKACYFPLEFGRCEKLLGKSPWSLQFLHDEPVHCDTVTEYEYTHLVSSTNDIKNV
jgi:hypothetical protein